MKRRWKGQYIKEGKKARLQSLSDKAKNVLDEAEDSQESAVNDFVESTKSGWDTGRRIVELGHLANQMKACVSCENPLSLHKIKSETRVGYASILYIECDCGIQNSVTTGKSHRPPGKMIKGMQVYDINTKAALGVMHAGVNYRQMNALMATMELKGFHHTTMMNRREEIAPHIESVAEESCLSALAEEVNTNESTSCFQKNGHTDNITPQPEGTFKYDMGWQKNSQNVFTLQCLIDKKVISKQTARKIASSGLGFVHLNHTFKQSGAAGLVQLLSDNSCGDPRVTANKKILDKIQNYFLEN